MIKLLQFNQIKVPICTFFLFEDQYESYNRDKRPRRYLSLFLFIQLRFSVVVFVQNNILTCYYGLSLLLN